ncbi:unnamed protein product, partial [Amoebophrya sp. A25]
PVQSGRDASLRFEKFLPEDGQQKHLPTHEEEKTKEKRVYMTTGFSLLPFLAEILPE